MLRSLFVKTRPIITLGRSAWAQERKELPLGCGLAEIAGVYSPKL